LKNKMKFKRLEWRGPAQGHKWSLGNARLEPWGRAMDVSGILELTPGLFRSFARLNTKSAEVLRYEVCDFADVFGDILASPHEEHPLLETWKVAILQMRHAIGLWTRINDKTVEEQSKQRLRKKLQSELQRALTNTKIPSHTAVGLTSDMKLVASPVNLLANMWLMFASVVSGEIEERPCESCGEYIYLGSGPGLQRKDTKTCGASCRKKKERAPDS
jgi:hypothetical protein